MEKPFRTAQPSGTSTLSWPNSPCPGWGWAPCLCALPRCASSHPSSHHFAQAQGSCSESHLDGHKALHRTDQLPLLLLMPGDGLFWFFILRSPNSSGKKCGLLHTHPVSSKLDCAMHEKFFGNWEQKRWLNKAVLSTATTHTEVVSTTVFCTEWKFLLVLR